MKLSETLQRLAQTRDELRLKLHLMKAEARDEWHELEKRWHRFTSEVDREAEAVETNILGQLAEEVENGYQKLKDSVAQARATPQQKNVALVKQAYERFLASDIEGLVAMAAETIEWVLPVVEGIERSGKRTGREGVANYFAVLDQHEEILAFEPQEYLAEGDLVVCLGHYSGRVRATAKEYRTDFVHRIQVEGDQFLSFHEYMNTAAVKTAFDA